MKKIFAMVAVAAGLLFAGNTANAQLGINVGYAPQTYTTTYTNNVTLNDTAKMNGFFAGVNYNTNITGDLNVSVGLQVRYNTKTYEDGASIGGALLSTNQKLTRTQMVLDVPILFNYGLKLSNDLKLSVFLGPTVSYALSGKDKLEGTNSIVGLTFSNGGESNWYDENEGNRSALDISGTAGLCLTFSSYRIYGGYNMGLLNTNKNDNTTTKGSNLFIGLGLNL